MTIQTGSITSPTKKSAAANEVRNRLDIVLRDLFLKINHRTIPFPTIVSNPATPNHDAKAIFASKGSGLPWFPEVCVSFIPTASISSASISTFCFSSDRIRFLIKNHTLHRGTFYQFIKILIVWSQFSAAIFNILRDGFNVLLLSYLCKVIFVSNCPLVSIFALFRWLSHLLKFKFMSMTLYFERESRVNGFLRWY